MYQTEKDLERLYIELTRLGDLEIEILQEGVKDNSEDSRVVEYWELRREIDMVPTEAWIGYHRLLVNRFNDTIARHYVSRENIPKDK